MGENRGRFVLLTALNLLSAFPILAFFDNGKSRGIHYETGDSQPKAATTESLAKLSTAGATSGDHYDGLLPYHGKATPKPLTARGFQFDNNATVEPSKLIENPTWEGGGDPRDKISPGVAEANPPAVLRTNTGRVAAAAAVGGQGKEPSDYLRLWESYRRRHQNGDETPAAVPGRRQHSRSGDDWKQYYTGSRDYGALFDKGPKNQEGRSGAGTDQYIRLSYGTELDLSEENDDEDDDENGDDDPTESLNERVESESLSDEPKDELPENTEEYDDYNKRANPGLFPNSACSMWLGPAQSRSCCVGNWFDWPTCFCAGYISCDDTVIF